MQDASEYGEDVDRIANQAFTVQKAVLKRITQGLWKGLTVDKDTSKEAVLIGTAAALMMQALHLHEAWHSWCVEEGTREQLTLEQRRAEFIDFANGAWDDAQQTDD